MCSAKKRNSLSRCNLVVGNFNLVQQPLIEPLPSTRRWEEVGMRLLVAGKHQSLGSGRLDLEGASWICDLEQVT
jgi:hypothetical protein